MKVQEITKPAERKFVLTVNEEEMLLLISLVGRTGFNVAKGHLVMGMWDALKDAFGGWVAIRDRLLPLRVIKAED